MWVFSTDACTSQRSLPGEGRWKTSTAVGIQTWLSHWGDALAVPATGLEVTQLDGVPLLRLGIEGRRLFDVLDLTLWVYNALDTE